MEYVPEDSEGGFVYVETCLKLFAKHIFTVHPHIIVVAIGKTAHEDGLMGHVDFSPSFYLRGRLINPEGHEEVEAIESYQRGVREIEPASDILDLELEAQGEVFVRYGQKE